MPVTPTRAAFIEKASTARVLQVSCEIVADGDTPVSAFAKLCGEAPSFLLESAEQKDQTGRFSFLGFGARATFSATGKTLTLTENGTSRTFEAERDPLDELERWMAPYRTETDPTLPLFHGGAVGYLSYDCIRWFEPTISAPPKDELGIPDMFFMVTEVVIAFDHRRRRIRIVVNAFPDKENPAAAYDAACERIRSVLESLAKPIAFEPIFTESTPAAAPSTSNTTREEYHAMVHKAHEYIRSGDIFQIVLAQRFETEFHDDALDLYRALRFVNPSPYMFCLRCPGGYSLVGSSPEVHVRLTGDLVEIRPIAGTRRRGATPEEDDANADDLMADPKERAEHLMLVDLARNDVGRIAEYGSVKVSDFMTIERYSHVMHIVTHVSGQLAGGRSAFDVMRATFPAGTVSGAPKVRAMQILNELEKSKRCSYSGAVGYFGFDGNHDSCIALRTVLLKDGKAYVQSGGGVVADSTPEGEYQETVNKA
ncbi:anthranilate synthase component I, partial [bacterium]|nr:anthranilate synthase component I [bacterium]